MKIGNERYELMWDLIPILYRLLVAVACTVACVLIFKHNIDSESLNIEGLYISGCMLAFSAGIWLKFAVEGLGDMMLNFQKVKDKNAGYTVPELTAFARSTLDCSELHYPKYKVRKDPVKKYLMCVMIKDTSEWNNAEQIKQRWEEQKAGTQFENVKLYI